MHSWGVGAVAGITKEEGQRKSFSLMFLVQFRSGASPSFYCDRLALYRERVQRSSPLADREDQYRVPTTLSFSTTLEHVVSEASQKV